MGTAWLTLRADLRLRWRAMLGMILLTGLVSGAVLTAAAGARRTDTAYPRLLDWAHASQVLIVPGEQGLRAGPGATGRTGYLRGGAPPAASGRAVLHGACSAWRSWCRITRPDTDADTAASLGPRGGPDHGPGPGAGRPRYNPADPHAVMIDQRMAALAHLRPGGPPASSWPSPASPPRPGLPARGPLALRVSGIVGSDDELVPDNQGQAEPRAIASPAFARRTCAVLLADGGHYADPAPARGQPRRIHRPGPRPWPPVLRHSGPWTRHTADEVAITQRAIQPEAVALAAFAAAAGLVALAILVQLLGRQLVLDSAEFPILRALGASRAPCRGCRWPRWPW